MGFTPHGYFYKPDYGAKGVGVYALYNAALDATDNILYGLSVIAGALPSSFWGVLTGKPSITVGDTDYLTFAAAIATLNSSAVETELIVPPGSHAVVDDLTVNANIALRIMKGATIAISTTKTLTINGALDAGLYQIFACTGTGKVVFGAGAVDYVKPEWWGANPATDSTAAVNAALTAAATNKGTVQFSGWYHCDSTVNFPLGPNVIGVGMYACGIDSYANAAAITGTGKIYQQYFMNFGVTQANNANAGADLNIIDLQYGANFSMFANLSLIGKAATTADGFVLRGSHPVDGANTNQFSNTIMNVRTGTADTEITGTGIKLWGTSTLNTRCNNNHLLSCCPGGFSTGFYVFGYNNKLTLPVFNGPQSVAAIEFADDASGAGTSTNVVDAPYFDAAITGDKILISANYNNASMGFNKWVSIRDVNPQTFLPTDVTIAGAGAARVRFVLDGVQYYPSTTPNGFDAPLGTVVNCSTAGYTFIKVRTGTTAYQDWMRLFRSWSEVVTVDAGSVGAGAELTFDITPSTVPSVATVVTNINAVNLEDGLIIRRAYFDGSVIKCRLYNYTGAPIDPASQSWRYVMTEY